MQRSAVGSPSDFFLLLDLGGDFVSLRELVTAVVLQCRYHQTNLSIHTFINPQLASFEILTAT